MPRIKKTVNKPAFVFNRVLPIVLLVVLVFAGLLFYFKGLFVAATVNGKPVMRLNVIGKLERQGGKKQLDMMIDEALIQQEAQKQKIVIDNNEIDKQFQTIKKTSESQNKNFDQLLATEGMTASDLKTQIKLSIILEKLLSKDITVTDEELNKYVDEQKAAFPENMKPEDIKSAAKNQLIQEKFNQKAPELIQKLRSNAKINYFVNY